MSLARVPVDAIQEPATRAALDQLQTNVQQAMNQAGFITLKVLYAAPARLTKGMVVYADGTTFNPGSGEGVYRYNGSAWVYLG